MTKRMQKRNQPNWPAPPVTPTDGPPTIDPLKVRLAVMREIVGILGEEVDEWRFMLPPPREAFYNEGKDVLLAGAE